jgi:enoyl-CoA hydratase
MDPEIVFSREGRLGKVLLNRPRALNALTLEMGHALEAQLRAWAAEASVAVVVVRGAGEKAFCAGGDIRRISEAAKAGEDYPYRFWRDEYRLNALIKHYPKPYVALIDGIAMGGGVGLSVHGSHRVATEHGLFAMPETGIGFFPDVGASYFLSRAPGRIGLYLGLSGARLRAADMLYAGIATHHVPRARLDELERALAADSDAPGAVLARFAEDAGPALLASQRKEIDRLFAGASLEAVLQALAEANSEFAKRTRETLAKKSPTSLAIAFREIGAGAGLSFDECLRMEWRIASRVPTRLADFHEGVRAVILDKDNEPRWSPSNVDAIDPAAIEAFFAPADDGELAIY